MFMVLMNYVKIRILNAYKCNHGIKLLFQQFMRGTLYNSIILMSCVQIYTSNAHKKLFTEYRLTFNTKYLTNFSDFEESVKM